MNARLDPTNPANRKSPGSTGNAPLCIVGIIFAAVGAPFLAVGVYVWQTQAEILPRDDYLGMSIIFGVLGAVFLTLGLAFVAGVIRDRVRAKMLMREGVCYDAEVVSAYFSNTQVNGRHGLILECTYTDSQGATHLVKSRALWNVGLRGKLSDYRARVWVLPHDAKKYFVEVLDSALAGTVDYDDR